MMTRLSIASGVIRLAIEGRNQEGAMTLHRVGQILSGLAMSFLTFDAALKLLQVPVAIDSTMQLGYPAGVIVVLGAIQIVCLVAYLVPRTAVLGAILWTAYLGGAVATHVRVENPMFTHVLFPVYVALLLWGGLWLRDERLRAMTAPRVPV
jgi:hypothetical protein